MSKPKLTEWFPADVKPVRLGVYQIAPFGVSEPRFSIWNGLAWSYFTTRIETLNEKTAALASHPADIEWRGLAEDPSLTKE